LQAVLIVTAAAAVFVWRATPVYRASATLLAKTDDPQMSPREELPLVAQALRLDGGRSVETQKRLVKSWPVVSQALRKMGDKTPVEEVMKRVKVSTFKDMDIIEVAVEDTDPARSARLANEIASSYITHSQLAARESAYTAKEFVKGQLGKVQKELAAAEERLRAFKRSHAIASLPDETKAKIDAFATLKASAEQSEAEVGPARARVQRLEALVGGQPERQLASQVVERNPVIDKLAENVADLEAQQAGVLAEYTEEHAAAKSIAARLAVARQKLEAEAVRVPKTEESALNPVRQKLLESLCLAKADSLVAEKKAANLKALVANQERELAVLPDDQLALARLERDVTTAERLYASLTQKYEEFRLAEAMRLATARLVEPAVRPIHPVKPRKLLTLSFALMMGLLVGIALASLKDRVDDSIASADEIADLSGLSVLGRVPDLGKDAPAIVADASRHSAAAEAYRILRTNLRFSAVDSDVRTVLVTSALAREGKTTVALNLAAALAAEGKKVVLVEGDMRRPTLASRTLTKPQVGLSELLVDHRPVEDALTASAIEGLEIITSGRVPPNPSELLASNSMRQLLATLRERCDMVIIDSPPLCPLADAAILSSFADATLLITAIGVTRRGALDHSLSLLANAKARIIGTVINRVRRSAGGYRRYYYYDYHYYGTDPSDPTTGSRPRTRGNGRGRNGKAKEESAEPRTAA